MVDDKELRCNFCNTHFSELKTLASHYYNAHNAVYNCEWCYIQFHSELDAKNHEEQRHIGKASFACLWCNFTTSQKKQLAQHRRDNHVNELVNQSTVLNFLIVSFACVEFIQAQAYLVYNESFFNSLFLESKFLFVNELVNQYYS